MDTKLKSRCSKNGCTKKLKILFYTCKCGDNFCRPDHIHPTEEHNCSYDFKNEGIKLLKKSLVKVVGDKLIKI